MVGMSAKTKSSPNIIYQCVLKYVNVSQIHLINQMSEKYYNNPFDVVVVVGFISHIS